MKVVVFVVVLAALAAAEEVAEVPVVAKAAEPAVQPFLHAEKLAAVDPATLKMRVLALPKGDRPEKRRLDQETVQRLLLGGPVMLSILDEISSIGRNRKLQSFLFPDGLASIYGYTPEEIAPLTKFLTDGVPKQMMFLNAAVFFLWNLDLSYYEMHVPSYYSLSKALSIAQSDSPFPHVLVTFDGDGDRGLERVGEVQVTAYGLRAVEKKSSLQQGNQQAVASVAVTHAVVQQNGTKVAAEVPVVAAAALPVVKPAVHTGSLTAVDLSTSYRLLTAPADYNAKYRQLDQETVQRVLNGPVMVSFRYKPDDKQEQMQTYLFHNGLGDFTGFEPEDIAPLNRFVNNGQSKALLFLTAGQYLHLQEMRMPVSPTYVSSSFTMASALHIEEDLTPFPQLMLLEESNRDFSQLRQVGKLHWGLHAA